MSTSENVRLLAGYNEWMNSKLYAAAASMPTAAVAENKGAFFGSLLGTLNHIVVADTIWLKRFALHPAGFPELASMASVARPTSLDQIVYSDLGQLRQHRQFLDSTIISWANSLTDNHLDVILSYTNIVGVAYNRRFQRLVAHFFNHQTHHRGQATTLCSQAGIDVGSTDLLDLIHNEP